MWCGITYRAQTLNLMHTFFVSAGGCGILEAFDDVG